jgi:hypothetical protein
VERHGHPLILQLVGQPSKVKRLQNLHTTQRLQRREIIL